MKNKFILLYFALILTCGGCAHDEENNGFQCLEMCSKADTIQQYNNDTGMVIELPIGNVGEVGSYDMAIENAGQLIHNGILYGIVVDGQDILIPCVKLSESFRLDSLPVTFSGNKYNCCNLLTEPNARTAFGCKLEVTAIEPSNR